MASSKEYLDFILEQLSELDSVSWRQMMGEYILYYQGKVIGGIYDDRFLVKPVNAAKEIMPEADMEQPYEGAKEMLLVDNVENREFLKKLVEAAAECCPECKTVIMRCAGQFNYPKDQDIKRYRYPTQSENFRLAYSSYGKKLGLDDM